MDTSGRRHRGLLTGDDLADYQAKLEEPVTLDYHDYTVCKCGPWSQGPVFLQQLALRAGFDVASMGHNSADFVHTVMECAKLAFADREAWYGDPDFVDVPLAKLLDPAHAEDRRTLVGDEASRELHPGTVDGRDPRLPPFPVAPAASCQRLAPPGRAYRRCRGPTRPTETRPTSTSSTATATWWRPRRAAGGCRVRR